MKKFLSKAKAAFEDLADSDSPPPASSQKPNPQANQPSIIQPPTAQDLLRYRFHWGTNLGSIFVLEKWLSGSMFLGPSSGDHELAAVTAAANELGIDGARAKWEAHWKNAVSEQDFEWLVREARCTSIRLPIGYFTLGEEWCRGTEFESVGAVMGIGVLLDFHFVYGGANGEDHGSATGKAALWGNKANLESTRRALGWIAGEARGMDGVLGLQIVNEVNHHAEGMYAFYEDVVREVARWDESLPLYISDAWDLKTALEWTCSRHPFGGAPRNPVVVDTHRYYTFSDEDRRQSPQQIIGRLGDELEELNGKEGSLGDRGEAQVIIGEWSCVLDGQTWGGVGSEEKDGLVTQFGRAQSQKWQQRAGGSYFWTYKMDWMDGGEWGFVEQVKKGNISPSQYLTLPSQEVRNRIGAAEARRGELAHTARQNHENYWNQAAPGKHFEHHLYSDGWSIGFSDAQKFFGMRSEGALGGNAAREGGDRIGCLEIWVKKRLLESGQRGEFVWIWEQGLRAGVGSFNECVGM
ncbi:glycoside hydrolase superfamily [Rhexocercosporidium sp. MPI-PUGE-AT-0058]|nr:glycoside hydrolase superfamily [Rhexocercosporidium sp. MPI-PUGE-AT-0058]